MKINGLIERGCVTALLGLALVGFGCIFVWKAISGLPDVGRLILIAGAVCVLSAGYFLLRYSSKPLKDVFATPKTVAGRVQDRRTRTDRVGAAPRYYLTVDAQEIEVSDIHFSTGLHGEEVSLTFWPNTRTIKSVGPFHPVVDATWLTTDVITLARAIRDERAYDRLPILADALEEAGCTDTTILEHCRQSGHHMRGCKVLDSILDNTIEN